MNAPAGREGLAKGFNLHENRMRTPGGTVKLSVRSALVPHSARA
jgi:hypothetical protein